MRRSRLVVVPHVRRVFYLNAEGALHDILITVPPEIHPSLGWVGEWVAREIDGATVSRVERLMAFTCD